MIKQDPSICPHCLSLNVYVKDSRRTRNSIWRKRECSDCGTEFKTFEILCEELEKMESELDEYNHLMKKISQIVNENKSI